jgi:putative flippase GtrA
MALLRQGSQFLVIGLLQLVLDWGLFVAASALGVAVAPANLAGRVGGALLGFWLNGRFTFAERVGGKLDWRHFLRFWVAWAVLTALSTWLVAAAAHAFGLHWAWLAKPVVEGVLAVLSFFVWRQLVFR